MCDKNGDRDKEWCAECAHQTDYGKKKSRARFKENPIVDIDLSRPMSVLMSELRSDVCKVRGKLTSMRMGLGWDDRIEHIEGLMSCGLIAMYDSMKEFKKFEDKFAKKDELPVKTDTGFEVGTRVQFQHWSQDILIKGTVQVKGKGASKIEVDADYLGIGDRIFVVSNHILDLIPKEN